jgi:hypothetical protein
MMSVVVTLHNSNGYIYINMCGSLCTYGDIGESYVMVGEEEVKHMTHHSKHEDINEDMNHGGGGTMVDEEMVIEQWCVKRK